MYLGNQEKTLSVCSEFFLGISSRVGPRDLYTLRGVAFLAPPSHDFAADPLRQQDDERPQHIADDDRCSKECAHHTERMPPAVLVGIEEIIRVPLRAEPDHDHEDRIGKWHDDPRQRLPSSSAHPVLPREEPEEDDRRDRSQGVQNQFARHIPVARCVDELPVDEADDAGGHGEIAEQPELQTRLLGPIQNPHRAERDEAARPRREVREVLLGFELASG